MSSSSSASGGIGFCGLLTVVFVVFKLLNKITWSWWWVFCPIWIGAVITAGILLIVGIVELVIYLFSK